MVVLRAATIDIETCCIFVPHLLLLFCAAWMLYDLHSQNSPTIFEYSWNHLWLVRIHILSLKYITTIYLHNTSEVDNIYISNYISRYSSDLPIIRLIMKFRFTVYSKSICTPRNIKIPFFLSSLQSNMIYHLLLVKETAFSLLEMTW